MGRRNKRSEVARKLKRDSNGEFVSKEINEIESVVDDDDEVIEFEDEGSWKIAESAEVDQWLIWKKEASNHRAGYGRLVVSERTYYRKKEIPG